MKIRRTKESDYEQLMQLYNGFVGADRYSDHKHDGFKKVLKNPNNFIFVAEDSGKLIGFATFSVRDVVRYFKPIAELDEIFVLPEYRQKGVGKKLMEEIEKSAKEADCYRIFIESHYEAKAGHKFYEALGFTNYGYHFIKDI